MDRSGLAYLLLLISVIAVVAWFALFTVYQLVTDRPLIRRDVEGVAADLLDGGPEPRAPEPSLASHSESDGSRPLGGSET